MLTATAAVACAILKETRNPYLPGIFNAIIIALMSCANTWNQVIPFMKKPASPAGRKGGTAGLYRMMRKEPLRNQGLPSFLERRNQSFHRMDATSSSVASSRDFRENADREKM